MRQAKSKRYIRILVTVVLLLALLSVGLLVSQAQDETGPLFAAATPPVGMALASDPTIVRARPVTLNLNYLVQDTGLLQSRVTPRPALQLNLFEGITLAAVLDRVTPVAPDGFAWIGHVAGKELSSVTLVFRRGVLAGHIATLEHTYEVRYLGGSVYAIYEMDLKAFPPEAEPLPAGLSGGALDAPPAPGDDGSTIDVLVVYTPAARVANGGVTGIEAMVNLAVAETNTAYANSQITQRLNLAHMEEVTYTESGSASTDLARLAGTVDGYMDDVHALRDAHAADVVNLIVDALDACGIAYLMSTVSTGFAPLAFSVAQDNCATGYYSFGHELGHNMGSQHDRANASSSPAYPYAYGYQEPGEAFRTIMAYNCPGGCTRIQYFSNPDVTYNGQPTGIEYQAPDAADNARSLNNTAFTVANFRVRASSPTPTATHTNTLTATPTPTSTRTPTPTPTATALVPAAGNLRLYLPLIQK